MTHCAGVVRENPDLRAVTRAGDLLGSRWAHGGSARPASLLETARRPRTRRPPGWPKPSSGARRPPRRWPRRPPRRNRPGSTRPERSRDGRRPTPRPRRSPVGSGSWRARPGPRARRPTGSITGWRRPARWPSRAWPNWPCSSRIWPRPRRPPTSPLARMRRPVSAGKISPSVRRGPGGRDGSPARGPHGRGAAARDQRPGRLADRGRRCRAAGPRARRAAPRPACRPGRGGPRRRARGPPTRSRRPSGRWPRPRPAAPRRRRPAREAPAN